METKICKKCGRELPLASFAKHHISKDGLMAYCNSCREESRKQSPLGGGKIVVKPFNGGNPDLAPFTPRELIEELKARGYKGKLTIEREITL
jgi:hypothetical protein